MRPPRLDAHQHFWHYDAAQYDWIGPEMAAIRRDFTPDDLRPELATAGVDGSVLVQVRQTLEETHWCLAIADRHPFVRGVVGWVDLRSPAVERDLERIAPHPKLVGVRHVVQGEPEGFMLDPAFQRGIGHLRRFDLTYDILIYERQLPEAIEFVSRFPDQRFVVDHLAKPDIRGGDIRDWRWQLRALARFPNVLCKLSGLTTEADWATWTPDQLRPYLETAADCFGPARLMAGSDWPVCTLAGSYQRTMDLVTGFVSTWPAEERDAVLGGNAAAFWQLPGPEAAERA